MNKQERNKIYSFLGPVNTCPDIFENACFYPFWVNVHTETVLSVTENEAFRKRCPEWIC